MAKIIDVPPAAVVPAPPGSGAEAGSLTFAQFLSAALEQYEPLGKGIKQIRQANRIFEAVESLNGAQTLRLETEDYETVKAAVEAAKWRPGAARFIVPFIDALEKAQDVKL